MKTVITVAATLERHHLYTEPPVVQTHQPGAMELHLTHHGPHRRQYVLTSQITIWEYIAKGSQGQPSTANAARQMWTDVFSSRKEITSCVFLQRSHTMLMWSQAASGCMCVCLCKNHWPESIQQLNDSSQFCMPRTRYTHTHTHTALRWRNKSNRRRPLWRKMQSERNVTGNRPPLQHSAAAANVAATHASHRALEH